MKKLIIPTVLMLIILAGGCKKSNPDTTNVNFTNVVFILNQGNYGKANGDISCFYRDSLKVINNIFSTVNGRPAGDVIQSMAHIQNSYYIVANSSGKVDIVDDGTFKQTGEIDGLDLPRYILGVSSTKAYISEWGSDGLTGAIDVLDLTNNTITKKISVGKGAENMIISNNKLFVACSGGYGNDSTVFVIDYTNDIVTDTLKLLSNPNSFAIDTNGKLWVLCGGKYTADYSALLAQPALMRINPASDSIETTVSVTGLYSTASNLCINNEKNKLYYGLTYGNGVYCLNIDGSTVSNVINQSAYGLGIDPKNDYIYCSNGGNGQSNGVVYRYNTSYQLVDTISVGIYPGGFLFN